MAPLLMLYFVTLTFISRSKIVFSTSHQIARIQQTSLEICLHLQRSCRGVALVYMFIIMNELKVRSSLSKVCIVRAMSADTDDSGSGEPRGIARIDMRNMWMLCTSIMCTVWISYIWRFVFRRSNVEISMATTHSISISLTLDVPLVETRLARKWKGFKVRWTAVTARRGKCWLQMTITLGWWHWLLFIRFKVDYW